MSVRVSLVEDENEENDELLRGPRKAQKLATYLYANEVADLLGIEMSAINKRVKDGYLHPTKGRKPTDKVTRGAPRLMFNPAEVAGEIERVQNIIRQKPGSLKVKIGRRGRPKKQLDATPAPTSHVGSNPVSNPTQVSSFFKKDGEKCAQAVRLFREGKGVLDIIEELRLDFEVSKYYWQSFLECQPSWVLPPKDFARVRSILDWREDPPTVEGFNQALNKCMTEAPEKTSLISIKESNAVDAALANLDDSEKDDE